MWSMAHPKLGPPPLQTSRVRFPRWAMVHGNFLWHCVGSLAATTTDSIRLWHRRGLWGIEGSGGGQTCQALPFFACVSQVHFLSALPSLLPLHDARHHRSTVAAQVMGHQLEKSHVPTSSRACHFNSLVTLTIQILPPFALNHIPQSVAPSPRFLSRHCASTDMSLIWRLGKTGSPYFKVRRSSDRRSAPPSPVGVSASPAVRPPPHAGFQTTKMSQCVERGYATHCRASGRPLRTNELPGYLLRLRAEELGWVLQCATTVELGFVMVFVLAF
jgi:hypothetical protein